MLEDTKNLGDGGRGFHTRTGGASAIRELQGFKIDLLAGAGAGVAIPVAAISAEDTVVKALNNAAGTITDVTADVTVQDGQITVASATDQVLLFWFDKNWE